MGAKRKNNTLVTSDCCPTCGQKLPDGPEAFVLDVPHGNGGYNRGCRCEVCVIAARTYRRNYQKKYYRHKLSKSGRFAPDQEEPLYPMKRLPNGRFK